MNPDKMIEGESARLTLTANQDASILKTAGQRRINFLWEVVQAFIAVEVMSTVLFVCAQIALKEDSTDNAKAAAIAALVFLTGAANLVIGFTSVEQIIQRLEESARDLRMRLGRVNPQDTKGGCLRESDR